MPPRGRISGLLLTALLFLLGTIAPGESGAVLPQGCNDGAEVRQSGGLDATTLNGALALLSSPLDTDTCIVIRDAATYSEQVAVRNFAFTHSTNTLRIMADPTFVSSAPVVTPPAASTAAFWVQNSSVAIEHISIISTNSVSYGVWASSTHVTISSVIVNSGGLINVAGVAITSYSSISHSSVTVQDAHAGYVEGELNRIFGSTFSNNSASGNRALLLWYASSNTIRQSLITNQGGSAAVLWHSDFNTIEHSSMSHYDAGGTTALYLAHSASNTVTRSSFYSLWAMGINLDGANCDFNRISYSTITTMIGSGGPPVAIGTCKWNSFTHCRITGGSQGPAFRSSPSPSILVKFNSVSESSITSRSADAAAVYIPFAEGQRILNNYIQGSTAVYIGGSTNTVVSGNVLVATGSTGHAISVIDGSVGLMLSSNTLFGGELGSGFFIDNSSGAIALALNTVRSGKYGLWIGTQAAGTSVSISTLTFQSLSAGATAIHFAGGTLVSTFAAVDFADAGIAVNVNGKFLSPASRITMVSDSGSRTGPSYENDPLNVIDWPATLSTGSFSIALIELSSITASIDAGGATSYVLLASTASNLTGTVFLASTTNTGVPTLTLYGLAQNTTYFLSFTGFGPSIPFAASATVVTLAASPSPVSFSAIGTTGFTANWSQNSNPAGTRYEIALSTEITFGTLWSSEANTGSSRVYGSLPANTTFYFRARAVNHADAPSAYALGAVITAGGIITISANRLPSVWYNTLLTVFNAQGAASYLYQITTTPDYVPTTGDPAFDGSALLVTLPTGIVYFHVTGLNGGGSAIGTAHYGPMLIDSAGPVIASISAQKSAIDPTLIADGGTAFSATPRFSWPAPTIGASNAPIVGYSFAASTNAADVPSPSVNTTLTFIDHTFSASNVYTIKVRALNLAGTWGNPASMTLTYSSIPNLDGAFIRQNRFNPVRGECAKIELQLSQPGHMKVELYTMLGEKVVTLADQPANAGIHNLTWCGKNGSGEYVSTGGYLIHIEAPGLKRNLKTAVVK